jgi:type IV secretion system protein VirB6
MTTFFFQGTLGSFMAYSQIGGSPAAQPGPQGQPPGSYVPQQTVNSTTPASDHHVQQTGRTITGSQGAASTSAPETGRYGQANT